MEGKTLAQLLQRYEPAGIQKEIITTAGKYRCRVNKEQKCMELTVDLSRLYRKADIRRLEDEIKKAYDLSYVHFIPHYGAELFTNNYIDEMLLELQFRAAVGRGFFYDYDYTVDNVNKRVEIRIGFSNSGIGLMYDDKTPIVASKILKDEFDIDYTVDIVRDDGKAAGLANYAEELRRKVEANLPKATPVIAESASVYKKTKG